MKISDILTMSLSSLWRRKARTFLTIFGVVIGATSIILMMSLGIGFEQKFNRDIEQFGNIKVIRVFKQYGRDKTNATKMTEAVAEQMEAIEGVESVLSMFESSFEMTSGNYECWEQIRGVDFDKLKLFMGDDAIAEGQFPEKGSSEILAGAYVEFYNPRSRNWEPKQMDLIGERFMFYLNQQYDDKGNKKRPKRVTFSGKLSEDVEGGYSSYIDKEVLLKWMEEDEKRYSENKKYTRRKDRELDSILVLCTDIDTVLDVNEQIKEMGFETHAPVAYIQKDKKNLQVLQMLLGGIGFVALFVAAIGITNTMIMSIYERTREIGVMKVLGAEIKNIMTMFLVEAGAIGFIGGVLAIGLSFLSSDIINEAVFKFLQSGNAENAKEMGEMAMEQMEKFDLSVITWELALQALIFSTAVGLISGLFPAYRATKLSALEAIKND